MPTSRRAGFETLRTVASSSLTGSYIKIGTPIANGSLLIKFTSTSTTNVTISDDGTNDKDILVAGGFCLYDIGSDGQTSDSSERLCIPGGTQFWVKGTAGTGTIYLTTIYQTTS